MTNLAGHLAFEDDGASPARCAAILDAQARFAPDVAGHARHDGGVALARRLHAILPEDRFDDGVLIGGGGALMLAADVRLDDRDALAAALAIPQAEARRSSDSALMLRALERWGDDAFACLLGEFAAVVWDARTATLTLARDFLGQRPLHYVHDARGVSAASLPSGLFAQAGRAPDLRSAAHFLADRPLPEGHSFFAGIRRVEPGTIVRLSARGVDVRRYWQPKPQQRRFRSIDAAIEEFRALLDQSVGDCLRGCDAGVATHLSGGLDSSAVTATAARLQPGLSVHALTAVAPPGYAARPGRFEDEREAAALTAARYPNIVHHCVAGPAQSPLMRIATAQRLYDRPMTNLANNVWLDALNNAAVAAGQSVLLIGQMGNLTFSHAGAEAGHELLRRGHWLRAARLAPPQRRRAIGAWLRSLRHHSSRADPKGAALLAASVDLLEDDPRAASSFERRLTTLRRVDIGDFRKATLAGWGLDTRDPTADRRIVEFCLALPLEMFVAGGVERGFARRALADRVPAQTLAIRTRATQAAWWHLEADPAHFRDATDRIAACPAAREVLDVAAMRDMIQAWPDDWRNPRAGHRHRMRLLPAIALGHFLCATDAPA